MRTVLAIHGFTGSPASFDGLAAHLGDGVRVLRPTVSGHTGRPVDADSFEAEVDRIARELVSVCSAPVHLLGYSLGGRLAYGLLCRHTHLFHSATVIGAHPGLSDAIERRVRVASDMAWVHMLREDGIAAFVDAWERLPLFGTQARLAPEVRLARSAERRGHDPRGLARALEVLGLGHMPDWSAPLSRLALPMTLVSGSEDEKFTTLLSALTARAPSIRFDVAPGVGHDVVLESPEWVAGLVLRALPGRPEGQSPFALEASWR